MVIFSLVPMSGEATPAGLWFVDLTSTAKGGDLSTRCLRTPARQRLVNVPRLRSCSRLGNSKPKLDSRELAMVERLQPDMTSQVTCRQKVDADWSAMWHCCNCSEPRLLEAVRRASTASRWQWGCWSGRWSLSAVSHWLLWLLGRDELAASLLMLLVIIRRHQSSVYRCHLFLLPNRFHSVANGRTHSATTGNHSWLRHRTPDISTVTQFVAIRVKERTVIGHWCLSSCWDADFAAMKHVALTRWRWLES